VLVGRGERDEWYTAARMDADVERLRLSNVPAEAVRFDGGHEWPSAFAEAAGSFLRSCT